MFYKEVWTEKTNERKRKTNVIDTRKLEETEETTDEHMDEHKEDSKR